MNERLVHRGPDSAGSVVLGHAMLAMRRLSIVDLAGGKQPIFNESGDIVVVCNGEIYNHRALREKLQGLGHRFSSHSDVETIVHAYEEYGVDCLKHLRGMFALALWDGRSQKLLLARDRMGEKPLYLRQDAAGRVWFTSELRSLAVEMGGGRCLTPQAFNLFLAFQYVPEPATALAGVIQLETAHYLELSPTSTMLVPVRYWSLADAHEDPSHPVTVVEESLDEACRLMGSADVPVAVALSGGIDSSLVAAITARHYPGQLHAFTIGYEGRPESDERSFAATLAKSLGIGFTEVELTTREVINGFPEMVAAMDSPIGDIAAYGYYAVCRAARQAGYPVLMSGTGGDEFFWGYEWVREAVIRNEAVLAGDGGQPWWKRLFGGHTASKPDFFGVHADLRNGDAWSRILMPGQALAALPEGYWLAQAGLDIFQPVHRAVSGLLNRTWLQSNCLALMDRMSMAHSVEVRLPLLDVDLVNRVTGMRNAGLTDWTKPHKWLLIEALRDALPADVLTRKKQGFTPPVQQWMKGIVERFSPLLVNGALVQHGLVDAHRVSIGLGGFSLSFLYKLVLLEVWTRIHVDGRPVHQLVA